MEWTREQLNVIRDTAPGIIMIDSVPGCGKTSIITKLSESSANAGSESSANAGSESSANAGSETPKCLMRSLYISLTNSVRLEITNMLQRHLAAYEFEYRASANHNFFLRDGEIVVEVATLDSWVEECLAELGWDRSKHAVLTHPLSGKEVSATDFRGKREALVHELRDERWPQKSLANFDQFVVDEVQDVDDPFLDILILVGQYYAKHKKRMVYAGDRLQNIFGKATKCPIQSLLMTQPFIRIYRLSICHRCPPNHLRFLNHLFPNAPQIRWPAEKPDGEKPHIIFLPGGYSETAIRNKASKIMAEIDRAVRDGYRLSDIAIISPFSSVNKIYGQLESLVDHKYCLSRDNIVWLYSDDHHQVDWTRGENKLTLSSIYANKGRTHRVTIVCNLTDGALPLSTKLCEQDCLTQENLLRVSLSRSCERLILAVEHPMSIFIRRAFHRGGWQEMQQFCTFDAVPGGDFSLEHYEPRQRPMPKSVTKWASIVERLDRIVKTSLPVPSVHTLSANETDVEFPEIIEHRQLYDVYGHYGELLLYREIQLIHKSQNSAPDLLPQISLPDLLQCYVHPIITKFRIMAQSYRSQYDEIRKHADAQNADMVAKLLYDRIKKIVTNVADYLVREIRRVTVEICRNPKACVMHVDTYNNALFTSVRDNIGEYQQPARSRELPPQTLWNLSLIMTCMHMGEMKQRPWIITLVNKCVLGLHNMPWLFRHAEAAAKMLAGNIAAVEYPVHTESPKIFGRPDMILRDGTILDIKCPLSDSIQPTAWVQVAMYADMFHRKVQTIKGQDDSVEKINKIADFMQRLMILDLTHGKLYSMDLSKSIIDMIIENSSTLLQGLGYLPNEENETHAK